MLYTVGLANKAPLRILSWLKSGSHRATGPLSAYIVLLRILTIGNINKHKKG